MWLTDARPITYTAPGRMARGTGHTGVVSPISARLELRARRDFGREAPTVVDLLDESTHTERVLAAALLSAAGRSDRLLEALALADVDWRDTLMWTYGTAFDLASEGWEARLDAELGPSTPT